MNDDNKKLHVINFLTRDFQASIDINHLVKVISLPHLNVAPASAEYVIGLMNFAGKIIPVIDLCMCLQISDPVNYDVTTPILICQTKNKQMFGIIVDKVHDIAMVTDDMMQKEDSGYDYHGAVSGAIKYDGYISLIINIDCLLDESVQLQTETTHE